MDFNLSRATEGEGSVHMHDSLTKESDFVKERRNTQMFEQNVDK